MSYLVVNEAEKSFGKLKVLKKTSISLEKGKFITLLGPSGSGKSTLLRIIAGLETMDGGTVLMDGVDMTHMDPKDRNVGMVFQQYVLFPNMNVYDNVAFGLKLRKMDKTTVDEKVRKTLGLMELLDKVHAFPHQLSGGQQQRVALARAIVLEPKILLFDEPLSALDRKIRRNLQIEIKRIQRELQITSVFVTHDQDEAMILSDEVFVMNGGVIEQKGTPEEIYNAPETSFVTRFIGAYNVFEGAAFEKLFKCKVTSKEVAVRPEVIQIHRIFDDVMTDSTVVDGKNLFLDNGVISNVTLVGSIVRYEVEKAGEIIHVDAINNTAGYMEIGERVDLQIPARHCIYLNK